MTKLFGVLATLVIAAVHSSALPATNPADANLVSREASPNIAKVEHPGYPLEARQIHNADYGSNDGPTAVTSSTTSATISTESAMQTMNTVQNERRAVGLNVTVLYNATTSVLPNAAASVLPSATTPQSNALTPQSNVTTPILPSALASLLPSLTPNAAFQNNGAQTC